MLKRISWTVALALFVLIAYLVLWPVPVRPVSLLAPAAPGYTGAHAANQGLAGLQMSTSAPRRGRSMLPSGLTASSTPLWPAAICCV